MITLLFLFIKRREITLAKNKIKNDTSENWAKATFVPKEDEIILYTDLLKIKIGDGKSSINDLPFIESELPPFEGYYELREEE